MKTLEITEITEILEQLTDAMLVSVWNEYQSEIRSDKQLYDFDDEFFETYFSTPMDAAIATYFGDINSWSDDYIMFNGYGNLESTNNPSDIIDITELSEYVSEHQRYYKHLLG